VKSLNAAAIEDQDNDKT